MLSPIIKNGGKFAAKKIKQAIGKGVIKKGAEATGDEGSDFAEDWLGIGSLNKGEDERIQERLRNEYLDSRRDPMQKDVCMWDEDDLCKVMNSDDYKYDKKTQDKVKSYFDYKYPGKQKLDATGRPY